MMPPPRTRVICIDEMGPLAVKTYPGEEWLQGHHRATFEPDYGRRGKLWTHGAFEPASGQAAILTSPGRDSVSHIRLIELVMRQFPADRWLLIEDNLSIHTSRQVKLALAAWPEIQILFLPKYACWLNLIEPWWKQLKSLALKGMRFETLDEITQALHDAVNYWNTHRHPYVWKKRPQEQLPLVGGFGVSHLSHISSI
jgi:transposase